jgi:hypothetical protein
MDHSFEHLDKSCEYEKPVFLEKKAYGERIIKLIRNSCCHETIDKTDLFRDIDDVEYIIDSLKKARFDTEVDIEIILHDKRYESVLTQTKFKIISYNCMSYNGRDNNQISINIGEIKRFIDTKRFLDKYNVDYYFC